MTTDGQEIRAELRAELRAATAAVRKAIVATIKWCARTLLKACGDKHA